MIVHPDNLETGKLFGLRHGFKVFSGLRYLGGFIGYENSKHDLMQDSMLKWENNISTIRKTVVKYPQESYAMVVGAMHLDWIFLKHVTKIQDMNLQEWRSFFGELFCLTSSL